MFLNTQLFDEKTVFIVDNEDQLRSLLQMASDIDDTSEYVIDIGSVRTLLWSYSGNVYGKVGDARMAIRPSCRHFRHLKKSVLFYRSDVSFYKRNRYKVLNFNDMFICDYAEEFSASEIDISYLL